MDRIVHTSLSALRAAMAAQTATAHNLANVNTPGFRADMASARALWIRGAGMEARAPASEEVVAANMDAGEVHATGRGLDVAMQGDAMLTVQAANGEEAYSRRGDLQLSDSGLLTTGDGHPVLGDSGPITLPPADSMRIAEDGTIWIVPPGGDPGQPQQVDRLKLVSPAGSQIVKGVDNLFRVPNGGALPSDPAARLTAGSLEGSNVESSQALIDMIQASRAWDTQLKLISTARDMDTAATDLMRLPG
jgi:flagellar basal-body rod protein FlgF